MKMYEVIYGIKKVAIRTMTTVAKLNARTNALIQFHCSTTK